MRGSSRTSMEGSPSSNRAVGAAVKAVSFARKSVSSTDSGTLPPPSFTRCGANRPPGTEARSISAIVTSLDAWSARAMPKATAGKTITLTARPHTSIRRFARFFSFDSLGAPPSSSPSANIMLTR